MPDSRHLRWDAQGLWRQLSELLPDIAVEVVERSVSTNSELLDRARLSGGRRGAPVTTPGQLDSPEAAREPPTPYGRRSFDTQPVLLVAEHQSGGRGRAGRLWQSAPEASLTFSLALPLAPPEWSGLSLAVGVALADALDPPGALAPRIGLKWPNDLLMIDAAEQLSPGRCEDSCSPPRGADAVIRGGRVLATTLRKLGGVLIETVVVGERRMCVVGVGLNVLAQATHDLSSGFACLHELDANSSAPQALHRVAAPLVRVLLKFESEGFAPFVQAFERRDVLLGRTVSTTAPQVGEGVAEGVDEHGALRVRAGGLHRLVSGEVSVRALGDPPAGS